MENHHFQWVYLHSSPISMAILELPLPWSPPRHVHSAVPGLLGTWQPLDLAEAAAYPLLPALRWALQPAAAPRLALRNGSSCGKALVSGAEEQVEVGDLTGREAETIGNLQVLYI